MNKLNDTTSKSQHLANDYRKISEKLREQEDIISSLRRQLRKCDETLSYERTRMNNEIQTIQTKYNKLSIANERLLEENTAIKYQLRILKYNLNNV